MTHQLNILFPPILVNNYRSIDPHCSSSHRLHRSGMDCWYTSHLCKEIISEAVKLHNHRRTQIRLIIILISFKWLKFKVHDILSNYAQILFKYAHHWASNVVMDHPHPKIIFLQGTVTNFSYLTCTLFDRFLSVYSTIYKMYTTFTMVEKLKSVFSWV